jgi:hypothetical protein
MRRPKTMRQMTRGEFQGNVSPPKSRPSRSIRTRPRMDIPPNQSTAFRPSRILVRGLCTSRKMRRIRKARAQKGRLMYQIQRQETSWVNVPPRMGPTPARYAHEFPDGKGRRKTHQL